MTHKLDKYTPTPEMLAGVKRQLTEAGVPHEQIPLDWLFSISAAMSKWIAETRDGATHVVDNLLHFDIYRGDDDKQYRVIDAQTGDVYIAESKDVYLFYGAVAKGKPIPFSQLRISEKNRDSCDGCGIIGHCLKQVREPYSDRLQNLCNYCVTYHDHPRVNEHGGLDVCRSCSVTGCSHHPSKKPAYSYG